jgi:hypothetical protein
MFTHYVSKGLLASTLALTLCSGAQAAQQNASGEAIAEAAAQLAARSDVFAASSAGLQVLPMKMAGSCPRSLMLKVDLGAAAAGKLADQIETLDGRVSQVFETATQRRNEGDFGAEIQHEIVLHDDEDVGAAKRLDFSAPALPGEPDYEPDFFERLFGTAQNDPSKGLSKQSFRVRVVAPNEIVSTFDAPSVSCEYNELVRVVVEDQRDGDNDRPGRDSSDGGDRGDRGRGSRGGVDAAGGAID